MTDNIYLYFVPLPVGIHEMITPCFDGYTIYLNSVDTYEQHKKSFFHAIKHIFSDDFDHSNIQDIEANAHNKGLFQ